MIVPTPAVLFARRDAWAKAIAAARHAEGLYPTAAERRAMNFVVKAVVDAAREDGVTFDAEAHDVARL